MSAYLVRVQREGDAWIADVEGLEGAHTYGRGIRHLEESVRDTVIVAADLLDDGEPDLEWHFNTGDSLIDDLAAGVRGRRTELAEANQQLLAQTEELVAALIAKGFSVRDAASLSGLSRARVSQLASPP